jgi:hypothetical protein
MILFMSKIIALKIMGYFHRFNTHPCVWCVCVLCVWEREWKPGARMETRRANGNQEHEWKPGARMETRSANGNQEREWKPGARKETRALKYEREKARSVGVQMQKCEI